MTWIKPHVHLRDAVWHISSVEVVIFIAVVPAANCANAGAISRRPFRPMSQAARNRSGPTSPCSKGEKMPRRVAPDSYMRAITLCPKGIDRVGDENANA